MKKNLKVGDRVSVSKVFTEEDVIQFANISKDTNPIHLDEKFAAASVFGQRIVQGMLSASLFSGLIGVELPGEGTIYFGTKLDFQSARFHRGTRHGFSRNSKNSRGQADCDIAHPLR